MGNVAKARGVGALLAALAGLGPRIALAERGERPFSQTGCGHCVELQLKGTPERRFLVILDANESATPSRLDSSSVFVRIGGGPALRLHNVSGDGGAAPAGSWAAYSLALPGDVVFTDGALSVALRFESAQGECALTVKREARFYLPVRLPRSKPDYTRLELHAGGGIKFLATENQRRLGGDGHSDVQLGFGGYPFRHHGFFLELTSDSYGTEGARAISPRDPADGKLSLNAIGFLPTYTFRAHPLPWLAVSYWASVTPIIFELTDDDPERHRHLTTAIFSLRERLRAAVHVLHIHDGTSFALAASVVHTLVPYGSLGDAPLAGSTVGVLAEVVIDDAFFQR